MIRAGSLAYSVFLLFLSAALSMLLYMGFIYMQESYARLETYSHLRDNCVSGLRIAIADQQLQFKKGIKSFEEGGSLIIRKRPWGCFKVVSCQAAFKNEEISQTTLLATENADLDQMALWLAPRNYALKVSGSTQINGKLRLPRKGIKAHRIGIRRFEGSELYQGELADNNGFVAFPQDLKGYWATYFRGSQEDDSILKFESLGDSINHSFLKTTIHAMALDPIHLVNESFTGNIIISSLSEITVGPKVHLDQVVLVAPKIRIISGANVRAHLISDDSIHLETGVKLKYPSSTVLLSERNKQSYFCMDSASTFEGLLLAEGVGELYKTNEALIRLRKGSTFRGTLISTGAVEMSSRIQGHLITKSLSLKTPGAFYEGVLLDANLQCKKGSSNLFVAEYAKVRENELHDEIVAWLH